MRSTFNLTKMALLNIFDLAEGEENNRFPLWTVQSYKASFDVRIRVISQIYLIKIKFLFKYYDGPVSASPVRGK